MDYLNELKINKINNRKGDHLCQTMNQKILHHMIFNKMKDHYSTRLDDIKIRSDVQDNIKKFNVETS